MPFRIEEEREREIERKLIGFGANTRSVKPVHIANGLFRAITHHTTNTELLNRVTFWQKENGQVPKGHEHEIILERLTKKKSVDQEINGSDLARFRLMLKGILNADEGVYMHRDRMESYSAGFKDFVSEDRIAQDGGEFFAEWLNRHRSPLVSYIQTSLETQDDVITNLCSPLLSAETKAYVPAINPSEVTFFAQYERLPETPKALWDSLAHSSQILHKHITRHPNKLFGLRLVTLFASFTLIRYLTSLESIYVPNNKNQIVPFLLDFSDNSSGPIARASAMSYILSCQSISRFYAWAFGEILRTKYRYTVDQILNESPPLYRGKELSEDAQEIWQLALNEMNQSNAPFYVCGQAMYDIMAREAEGNPITYLRQLGHRSGLLWPPINTQPTKRFALQQDMLEVLIRGVIEPGESISLSALQKRFWHHYGIIIGGGVDDEDLLVNAGIYQADKTALTENRDEFATRLSGLDLGHMLADGVFQVTVEV
ncbi:hypothetical protein [Candidatus Leptofilum sp.]|uniref:hypothetical protein n=1 Tax=Candidatus Leptofilum sp. TaxID=3241576 RepID=UPI003B58F875